jgi:hypothetical protein
MARKTELNMKKRIATYGTLIAIVLAFVAYSHFRTGVTRANYLRIDTNMTRAEITELLGGPTGKYPSVSSTPNDGKCEWWGGNFGHIILTYDKHDRIIWKEWHADERGIWSRITGVSIRE